MSTVTSTNEADHVVDQNMGIKVKNIMEKYVGTVLTEETADQVMADLITEFGEDVEAQVLVDDETTDIEVIIRDTNGVLMKCSSLKLFQEA